MFGIAILCKFGKAPFIKGWFCKQELSTCGSQSQLISASGFHDPSKRSCPRHPKTVLHSAKKCCSRQSAWRFVLALPKLSLQKGRSLIPAVLVSKVPNTVISEAMVTLCEIVFLCVFQMGLPCFPFQGFAVIEPSPWDDTDGGDWDDAGRLEICEEELLRRGLGRSHSCRLGNCLANSLHLSNVGMLWLQH